MGGSLRNRAVYLALAFSLALIAGAYFLAKGSLAPQVAQASTESALLQAIATRDSTGDGLPDWEKELYGIPLTATTTDYFHLGMTDGEAVAKGLIVPVAIANVPAATSTQPAVAGGGPAPAAPGSLTDVFAKNFFTLYLSAKEANNGTALSQDQLSSIATQAFQMLVGSVAPAPDFKQASDLTVSGSGPDALRAYAADAEQVLRMHGANLPKSELQYLSDALGGDTTAVTNIETLAKAYRDTATGIAALTVPTELASTDLALVNAMARVSEAANDFANYSSDPVTAMLALEQYPGDVQELATAFQQIANTYAKEGVTLTPGTPGASFVNVIQSVSATASTTP